MLYLRSKFYSFNVDIVTKNKVNEWLKRHDYNHVNATQIEKIPSGYDYGDEERWYYDFPLHYLINRRNPDINLIHSFLEMGADPNFRTKTCLGPVLFTVIINSNFWNDQTVDLVQLLIKHGANINIREKWDRDTVLHIAAYEWTKSFAEKIIEVLIENGADITAKNKHHNTPYDNVLLKHRSFEHKNKPLPEKILYLLGNRE